MPRIVSISAPNEEELKKEFQKIIDENEKLLNENKELKDKIKKLEKQLNEAKEDFDVMLGQQYAYQNALDKLEELYGFAEHLKS